VLNYGIQGSFIVEIVDFETNKIEQTFPLKNNLILNQGLLFLSQRSFIENILYCAVGTSSNAPLYTDIALGNEVDRTGVIDSSVVPSCLTSYSAGIYTHQIVFKFGVRQSPLTIGEIGWSFSSIRGSNLFSKASTIDNNNNIATITIGSGKFLRVTYFLKITLNPVISTLINPNISNFSNFESGRASIQYLGLKAITGNGQIIYYDSGLNCNEPYSVAEVVLSSGNSGVASLGTGYDISYWSNAVTPTTNIFQNNIVTKFANYGKNDANFTGLYTLALGPVGFSQQYQGYTFIFNSGQTKQQNYLLPLQFQYILSRA